MTTPGDDLAELEAQAVVAIRHVGGLHRQFRAEMTAAASDDEGYRLLAEWEPRLDAAEAEMRERLETWRQRRLAVLPADPLEWAARHFEQPPGTEALLKTAAVPHPLKMNHPATRRPRHDEPEEPPA